MAVRSVMRCRRCRGHRCAGGVRQWRLATVATPGEWQCKTGGVRRLAVANGPNIFQMLLVVFISKSCNGKQIIFPDQQPCLILLSTTDFQMSRVFFLSRQLSGQWRN